MAIMIPSNLEEFTTEGEGRCYRFIEKAAKPDSQFLCWYCPDINGREPDFVLFFPQTGLFIFEVKDWSIEQIRGADQHYFDIAGGGTIEKRQNPLAQGREYLNGVRDKIKADGYVVRKDTAHAGSGSPSITG